jgi:hypothetical protein
VADLNIICWLWGNKYSDLDVTRLHNAVRKNLKRPHRFLLFTDQPLSNSSIEVLALEDRALASRSCFCRLRMFDPEWQKRHGITGTILSLDLDLLIVAPFDAITETQSTFKILQGVNAVNPNPFNASIMLLQAGCHADVWHDFSPVKAKQIAYHEFPDDQGWIWFKLPHADGWKAGSESGIYGFQKPGWPEGSFDLPHDARIVSFIGKRKPSMYKSLPWVKKHWV